MLICSRLYFPKLLQQYFPIPHVFPEPYHSLLRDRIYFCPLIWAGCPSSNQWEQQKWCCMTSDSRPQKPYSFSLSPSICPSPLLPSPHQHNPTPVSWGDPGTCRGLTCVFQPSAPEEILADSQHQQWILQRIPAPSLPAETLDTVEQRMWPAENPDPWTLGAWRMVLLYR